MTIFLEKFQFSVSSGKRETLIGFTLIELLVVAAIIGLLASVVLISLSGARNKAKDARVTADMDLLRKGATSIYASASNYANVGGCTMSDTAPWCTGCTDSDILKLCQDIGAYDSQAAGDNLVVRLGTGNTTYCAYAHLIGAGTYWCVDGNLISKGYSVTPATCAAGCTNCSCE